MLPRACRGQREPGAGRRRRRETGRQVVRQGQTGPAVTKAAADVAALGTRFHDVAARQALLLDGTCGERKQGAEENPEVLARAPGRRQVEVS